MKDEIKEILGYIDQFVYVDQTYNDIKLSKIDSKLLLDYIINLQEKYKEADNDRHTLFEQKEKAIEYIKQYKELDFSDLDLLNILQGEDKDE